MSKEIPKYPVEITLKLIGHKQKILVLRDLLTGTKRFGELKNSLELLLKIEYTLTDFDYSLKPILDSMYSWGYEYKKINT